MTEMHSGYGSEPLKTPFEDGTVLPDTEPSEYDSQDEHFAAVDRLSDLGVATYADAAKRLGYAPAEYEGARASVQSETTDEIDALFAVPSGTHKNPNYDPNPGAAVSLRERAVAVAGLMDGISMQNKLSGAMRSDGVRNSYRNAAEVLDGMKEKAQRFRREESRAVELLAKTAAMRAVGFNEAEIAASQAGIHRNLSQLRGTGSKVVRLRNKQKKVTVDTARKVTGY